MQVELPPVFWGVCVVTVLSPGPAVLMTLGNALTDRRAEVGLGIAGLFCGALLVALVTAAGVGALLHDQPRLAIALHWLGASYLGWLGLRLWRAASRVCAVPTGAGRRRGKFSKIVLASPPVFPYSTSSHGGVAQLGERLTGSQEVRGSIPLVSTRALNEAPTQVGAFFHIGTQGQRRHHDPPGRQDRKKLRRTRPL